MKKTLIFVLALCLLAMPSAALAQANAYTAYASNFQVLLPGQEEPVQVGVAFQVGGGLDAENERGYAQILAQGGDQLALQAVAAMENGQYKAYLAGMSSYLRGSVDSLVKLVGDELPATVEPQEDLRELPEAAAAYARALDGAASARKMIDVMREKSVLESAEAQEAELFGETVEGYTRYHAALTPSQAAECLTAYLEEDAQLKAIVEEALAQTKDGKGQPWTLDSLTKAAKKQDGNVYIDLTAYAPEDFAALRIDLVISEEADGAGDAVPIRVEWKKAEADGVSQAAFLFSVQNLDGESVSFAAEKNRSHDGALNLSARVNADIEGQQGTLALDYTGDKTEQDGAALYEGVVALGLYDGADAETMIAGVQCDVGLQIAPLPEGELLSVDLPAVDLSALDPEGGQMRTLTAEAGNAIMQAMGVLMGAPGFAQLMGAFSVEG